VTEPCAETGTGLRWPRLTRGTLLRRYRRFLADVRLDNGKIITAHCPNTGSMKGCCEPGRPVYLSRHDNPRRKLAHTWELIEMPGSLVGINTLVPNRLVALAAERREIPELSAFTEVRREVTVEKGSRIDLVLSDRKGRRCVVEIKNCTLVDGGVARFPDAVTSRGLKHLELLQRLAAEGCRSLIFFFIQRMDADRFAPADDIDAAYGACLRRAAKTGVSILAYDTEVSLKGIRLRRKLPCHL
jgi:sugar fermentation stimulation protein A